MDLTCFGVGTVLGSKVGCSTECFCNDGFSPPPIEVSIPAPLPHSLPLGALIRLNPPLSLDLRLTDFMFLLIQFEGKSGTENTTTCTCDNELNFELNSIGYFCRSEQ